MHVFARQKDEVIRAGSSEVTLDLIVRDTKGQRVINLAPGDLRILDNGMERKISSFKLVEGSGTFSAASEQLPQAAVGANSPRVLDPLREVRLVTLIFNRLDLNSEPSRVRPHSIC